MESTLIRTVLRNDQWERIAPERPGKAGDSGATARDNRMFVEAVLRIARTGAPWRDPRRIRQLVYRLHVLLALGTKARGSTLVDAGGNVVRFVPPPGQRHDVTSVDVLMAGITCPAFIPTLTLYLILVATSGE
jgi:transposase